MAFHAGAAAPAAEAPLRVLLLSGDNNHAWAETTPVLRAVLEADGRCQVAVTEEVPGLTARSFAPYEVILSNYNTFKRPAPTDQVWKSDVRSAFLGHLRSGHGLVVVHAGSSVFYDWPEFQQVAGTSWTLGTTRHGQRHVAPVNFTAIDHPITRGLKPFWTFDEFWENLVVHPGATVLAMVTPEPKSKGGGTPAPSLLTTEYGRGRGVCLLLGHDVAAMRNPAFRTLLVRATEWAARGKVAATAAADWPDSAEKAAMVAGLPAATLLAKPRRRRILLAGSGGNYLGGRRSGSSRVAPVAGWGRRSPWRPSTR
ncbi:MAG: ThuA domain-containing protein [Verrucomicrobia bacterium]|nr:ThuA domain-containing protein [Verrucomicrobiota bacterium]